MSRPYRGSSARGRPTPGPSARSRSPQRESSRSKTHNGAGTREQPSKRSPSPQGATSRSPSPQGATSRSPSPQGATSRSPSPQGATSRSPSPQGATSRSPSPQGATSRSPSPQGACSSRSPSPQGALSRSPSPQGVSSRRRSSQKVPRKSNDGTSTGADGEAGALSSPELLDRLYGVKVSNFEHRPTNKYLKAFLTERFMRYGNVFCVTVNGSHHDRYALVFYKQKQEQEKALTADTMGLGIKFNVALWSGPSPYTFGIMVTNIINNDSDLPDRIRSEFSRFGDINIVTVHGPNHQRFARVFYNKKRGQEKALSKHNPFITSFGEITVTAWNKPPPNWGKMALQDKPTSTGVDVHPRLPSCETPSSLYGVKVSNFEKKLKSIDIKRFLTERFVLYGNVECVTMHGCNEARYALVFFKQKREQEKSLTADTNGPLENKLCITPWNGPPPCIFGIVVTNINNNDLDLPDRIRSEFGIFGDITVVQMRGTARRRFSLVFYKDQKGQEKALAAPKPFETSFGKVTVTAWHKPPPSGTEMSDKDIIKMISSPIVSMAASQQKASLHPLPNVWNGPPVAMPPPVRSGPPVAIPPLLKNGPPVAIPPLLRNGPPVAIPPLLRNRPPVAMPPLVRNGPPVAMPPLVRNGPPVAMPPLVWNGPPVAIPPPVWNGPPLATPPPGWSGPPVATPPPGWNGPPVATPPPVWNGPPVTVPPPVWNGPPVTVPPPVWNGPPVTVPPPVWNGPPVTVPPPVWNEPPVTVPPSVWNEPPVTVPPPVWNELPVAVQPTHVSSSGETKYVNSKPLYSSLARSHSSHPSSRGDRSPSPLSVPACIRTRHSRSRSPGFYVSRSLSLRTRTRRSRSRSPCFYVSGSPSPPTRTRCSRSRSPCFYVSGSPSLRTRTRNSRSRSPCFYVSGSPSLRTRTRHSRSRSPCFYVSGSPSLRTRTRHSRSRSPCFYVSGSPSSPTRTRHSRSRSPCFYVSGSPSLRTRTRRSMSRLPCFYVSGGPYPRTRTKNSRSPSYSRSLSPSSYQLYSERYHMDERVASQSRPLREDKSVGVGDESPSLQKSSLILWINNLEESISSAELSVAFKPFGEIEQIDIKEGFRKNGKQAFLQYNSVSSVIRAIRHMDGTFFRDRKLQVDFAYPQQATNCLWVFGVTFAGVTEQYLTGVFQQFGHVQKLLYNPVKGAALVLYNDAASAVKAMDMKTVAGHPVKLGFANRRFQLGFCHSMESSGQDVGSFYQMLGLTDVVCHES